LLYYSSEKITKIGQYLPELITKINVSRLFMAHSVGLHVICLIIGLDRHAAFWDSQSVSCFVVNLILGLHNKKPSCR